MGRYKINVFSQRASFLILARAHSVITLYSHGTGPCLACKTNTRDAFLSYMMKIVSGETLRRVLMLH